MVSPITGFFLRKMLRTQYGPVGARLSDSRDPIFSNFRDMVIIFSDSRFPNRVRKKPLKNLPDILLMSFAIHEPA